MYSPALHETCFTQISETIGDKIAFSYKNFDNPCVSFFSTVASLLYKRIREGEKLEVSLERYRPGNLPIDFFISTNTKNCLFVICVDDFSKIHAASGDLVLEESITAFFKKDFPVRCYINNENRYAVLVIKDDLKSFRMVQSCLPLCLPWFFERNRGGGIVLSGEEMSLLNALREDNMEKYISSLNKIFEGMNLDAALQEERIERLLKAVDICLTGTVREQITRYEDDLIRLYTNIVETQNTLRQAKAILAGIELQESQSAEIRDYLLNNKSIRIQTIDSNRFVINVLSTFEYFDDDILKRILSNNMSVISRADVEKGCPIKDFFKKVFLERVWKLKVMAGYSIDYNTRVSCYKISYDSHFNADYIPNPHTEGFGCIGDYAKVLADCAENLDFIGIFEQCIASCMSLNFGDSVVIEYFMQYIANHQNIKCVVTEDGEITIGEAFRLINNSR